MPQDTPGRLRALCAFGLGAVACALVLAGRRCEHSPDSSSREPGAAHGRVEEGPTPTVVSVAAPSVKWPPRLPRTIELECERLATIGCDVREQSCQEQLFELARCVSGQHGVRPPLDFVSEAGSRVKRQAHRAQTRRARTGLEQAVRMLGLSSHDEEREASRGNAGRGASAYYAPRERIVFLVTGEGVSYTQESTALTLLHEYAHAIQDRHGALLALQNARDTYTFDQELAEWSHFEGEATLYEEAARALIQDRDPGAWLVTRMAARTQASDSAIVRQRRPLEASFALVPYTYGAYWATSKMGPPRSTHQLLATRHEWPPPDARGCPDVRPSGLVADHRRPGVDSLGAWLVQAYVRHRTGDAERARAAARAWRGDWVSVHSGRSSRTSSITWRTCWDSATTAIEMRALMDAHFRESSGYEAVSTLNGEAVTLVITADALAEHAAKENTPSRP